MNALGRSGKLGYLPLHIGSHRVEALVDTGASSSVMSETLFKELKANHPCLVVPSAEEPSRHQSMRVANGQQVPILGHARVHFKIFDSDYAEDFYILPQTHTTILGWPFFADNDMTIDCKRRLLITQDTTLQINAVTTALPTILEDLDEKISLELATVQGITIPPYRQESVYCRLVVNPLKYPDVTGIVEPREAQLTSPAVDKYAIAHALPTLDKHGGCHVIITNTTEFPRRFPKNLEIAKFTILTVDDADDVQPIHPLAADVVQQVANKIEFDRYEFREIIGLGIQKEQPSINTLEDLDKNVAKANQEFQENDPRGEIHTISYR